MKLKEGDNNMQKLFDWLKHEKDEHWPAFWEAVKEPAREIVLALFPFLLAYINAIPAQWAVVLYTVLRTIDQYLHEKWKANKDPEKSMSHGLARF